MSQISDLVGSYVTDFVAVCAAGASYYLPTIEFVTAVACVGSALVILFIRREILIEERWVRYFGWAFLALALQYLPQAAVNFAESWSTTAQPALQRIQDFAHAIGSLANNLLFFAAARALLGYRPHRHLVPVWAWLAGVFTLLAVFCPHSVWQRLPDGIFSAACLTALGWAFYLNFTPDRRRVLAFFNLLVGVSYGILNIIYALGPAFAEQKIWPSLAYRLQYHLDRLEPIRPDLPKESLGPSFDALIFSIAFLFKLLLFIGAMLLIVKGVATLSRREARDALDPIKNGRQEYLSDGGILKALGLSVGADLAGLCFRLPETEANQVAWWRWLRDPALKENLRNPERGRMPDPDNSVVGWVFAQGNEVTSSDLSRDPAIKDRYSEYIPGMKALVAVPLIYHGAVIGCLNVEWRNARSLTASAVQRIRQIADLLAPTVHARRQANATAFLSDALHHLEMGLEPGCPEALARVVEIVHDMLAPVATGLYIAFGFNTLTFSASHPGGVTKLRKQARFKELSSNLKARTTCQEGVNLRQVNSRLVVEKVRVGSLVMVIEGDRDPSDHPTLVSDYLHRRTVKSLVADTLMNIARINLDAKLNRLQTQLQSVAPLSPELWLERINSTVQDVGLLWAVANVSLENKSRLLGSEAQKRVFLDSVEWKTDCINTNHAVSVKTSPKGYENAPPRLIQLKLPTSGGSLLLGVARPKFGDELRFASPWRIFLERLAETADSALDRIERHRLEFEANRLTQVATRIETAALLMHELKNQTLKFATGAQGIEDALFLNDRKEALLRVAKLKEAAGGFSELAGLLKRPVRPAGRRVISLIEAVEQVRRVHETGLAAKQISLVIAVKESRPVEMPIEVTILAISGLVANAAAAIKEHGTIKIETEEWGKLVLCHVTDDGPGVDPSIQESLFELGTTTRATGGGWGLAFARWALRRRHGDLILDQTRPGRTRFTIRLPRPANHNPE